MRGYTVLERWRLTHKQIKDNDLRVALAKATIRSQPYFKTWGELADDR